MDSAAQQAPEYLPLKGRAIAFGSDDRLRVMAQHPLPVIPAERAGLSPGEREPESSNQSGSCIHAGRGLLGPGSREPG
jgi:hypothetical protein